MNAAEAAGRAFLALTREDEDLVRLLTSPHRIMPGKSTSPVEPEHFPKINFHVMTPGPVGDVERFRFRCEVRAWADGAHAGPGMIEALDARLVDLLDEMLVFANDYRIQFQVGGHAQIPSGASEVLARARDFHALVSPDPRHVDARVEMTLRPE